MADHGLATSEGPKGDKCSAPDGSHSNDRRALRQGKDFLVVKASPQQKEVVSPSLAACKQRSRDAVEEAPPVSGEKLDLTMPDVPSQP